ncbi:MAG: TorF family putative porin [Lysobacteraceae bacterium]
MYRSLLVAALAFAATPASAASLSATLTAASDYLYDGVSQTEDNAAAQGSLDLSFENGFYIGAWASNVDFGADDNTSAEIDYYAGFARELESGWGYDLGISQITYVGGPSEYDYTEVYAGLTFPTGTGAQVWFADDDEVFGGSTWRAKLTHSFELTETVSLDVEATRTHYSDSSAENFNHFQFGFSKTLNEVFSAYLGYSDTSLDDEPRADGRVLFNITASFDIF